MEIFILGKQGVGKSSIQKVVFQKLSPHQTIFLQHGNKAESIQVANNPFIQFTIKDFPPDVTFSATHQVDVKALANCKSIIFVLDGQMTPYDQACLYFVTVINTVFKINQSISFDVFIHKTDGDYFNSDMIKTQTSNEVKLLLKDAPIEPNIHLTSIYDHSIFQAMSKVVQKVLPHTVYFKQMLNSLVDTCKIQKAILFDVLSKIYLATDREKLELEQYQICSEMIDVTIDVSYVYGLEQGQIMNESGDTNSIIKLQTNYQDKKCIVLQLNEVEKQAQTLNKFNSLILLLRYMALVCIMSDKMYQNQQHIINYNINCFKKGLSELLRTLKFQPAAPVKE